MNNLRTSKKRKIAWFLLWTFCIQTFYPNQVYAGGPDQPEVRGFTPISVSDMVDPFTGDFTYNIPLIQIDGYPLNLVYNSGVTMDQEASWVGLGWSLHTGSLNRSMRGLPDDFNGDIIEKTISMKENVNVGADFGIGVEIIGLPLGLNLNAGIGFNYSNYTGFGTEFSFGPSFKYGKSQGGQMTAGFSLSGSSENGASFAPSLGLSFQTTKGEKNNVRLGGTISAPMNSRAGLQQIGYSATMSQATGKSASKDADKTKVVLDKISPFNPGASGSFNIGLHTYTPSAGPNMTGFNFTGSVAVSGSFWGVDGQGNLAVNFSRQWIPEDKKIISSPSYGYMNTTKGQKDKYALLDFNRDNDGSFTKYSKDLPSAFQTYDVFSVHAQGTGGSFRPYRNDATYVFDPHSSSNSYMGNFGLEVGAGTAFDLSADIVIGKTNTQNGIWSNMNNVKNVLKGIETPVNSIIPEFSMIEANEKSVDFDQTISTNFAGSTAVQYHMTGFLPTTSKLNTELKTHKNLQSLANTSSNKRSQRMMTNNQLYFLSLKEAYLNSNTQNGVLRDGFGVNNYSSLFSSSPAGLPGTSKGHHIGEVTQLGLDGRRYVFGLPAYNITQEDVTFAVGESLFGSTNGLLPSDYYSGLLTVSNLSTLASVDNNMGIDKYYSKTVTPAYAHSYMLTSILTDDYIDSDNTPGPSKNDFGNYVKFQYTTVSNYNWKTPIEENAVYYNEGLKTDKNDDKASYVYGSKTLYYVEKIESKNQVLVFKLEDRKDARGASNASGGYGSSTKNQKRISKITLYNLKDYETNPSSAVPLQEVEFTYSYTLCPDYALNVNNAEGGGKLTLKSIKFKYQGSNKMRPRGYTFDYSTINPSYNLKATDRWGAYKANASATYSSVTSYTLPLSNSDYPYALQDKAQADINASAWSLVGINLPSGGRIQVTYEADDYAFVQHKPAAKMFEIVGVGLDTDNPITSSPTLKSTSKNVSGQNNLPIYFKLSNQSDYATSYANVGDQLYFKCLTDFSDNNSASCEFISGYATVKEISIYTSPTNIRYGKIILEPEKLKDGGTAEFSPIAKAAILFGRLHLSKSIQNVTNISSEPTGTAAGLTNFANSIVSAASSLGELFTGPNMPIYNDDKGRNIMTHKSFVRLKEATGFKLGGGARVAMIKMYDNWNTMTNNAANSSFYGQEYKYVTAEGKSSGVASYEPQLGGDENPWRTAYQINHQKLFATDDNLFIEEPIMESQFPSPSVGYSRVEIKNLTHQGVSRTATGKIVKEFYTARDFPTIVNRSDIQIIPKNSFLPLRLKYQLLNASQGFVIELNDMHGKQKSEKIYGENQTSENSSVEYRYQMSPLNIEGAQNFKLVNTVNTINKQGQQGNAEIGVRYDVVSDFRESETSSTALRTQIGVNGILVFIPIPVPSVWPKIDETQNRFRSSTVNKTINRFSVLKETIVNQDGSIVRTSNLAYDAQSGEVLVTETKTNFEDDIFTLNYPAYWMYPSFGRASENVLYTYNANNITAGGFVTVPNSFNFFEEGDEIIVYSTAGTVKGWVNEKTSSGIIIMDKAGNPITATNAIIKIIRSGHRNKQSTSMGNMTTFQNPISSIPTNQFGKVLNATAIQFGQTWKTYCDCFDSEASSPSKNPYILGTKGNWRPWKSYTYLTERSQTNYNGNTNIRKDGMYTGYNPFYKLSGGKWEIDNTNWTYVSEVTEFSPNGMTLETKDALGRYSANTYGFKNTLTTGTAVNTRTTQFAVASFEDEDQTNCADKGFFSLTSDNNTPPISDESHTGKKSIKVTGGTSVTFKNILEPCDATEPCNIMTQLTGDNIVTILNATAPFTIDFVTTNNAQAYRISEDQFIFHSLYTSSDMVTATIKDARGCEAIFQIIPGGGQSRGTSANSEYQIITPE